MRSSYIIAFVIALISIIWIGSGFLFPTTKAQGKNSIDENAAEKEIIAVRVRDIESQPFIGKIVVTGRTKADRSINLKAETDGQVVELLVEKGTTVTKGDTLAKLEIRDRAVRVREAEKLVAQRDIQYKAAKALEGKGFNSKVRLAEAQAQLESARAQLKEARSNLDKTTLTAPFDAIIDDKFVELGDFLSKGDDVFSLVDLNPIKISGFVTEQNITQISIGSVSKATFLDAKMTMGKISFIAASASPETRTFEVEISVENEDHAIKEGLTAQIEIPLEEKEAHKISPSILSLADDGTVGIKIVNTDNIVEFKPIDLLQDTPEFLWVGGLPKNIRVITVGQEFVINGQKVKPVPAKGEGLL